MKKFELVLADVCLSGYWCGHHLPVLQVPVWKNMSDEELKQSLFNNINQGVVDVNSRTDFLDDSGELTQETFLVLRTAVQGLELKEDANSADIFPDLEEVDPDFDEVCQAFFVLVEVE